MFIHLPEVQKSRESNGWILYLVFTNNKSPRYKQLYMCACQQNFLTVLLFWISVTVIPASICDRVELFQSVLHFNDMLL